MAEIRASDPRAKGLAYSRMLRGNKIMNPKHAVDLKGSRRIAEEISGYTYGSPEAARSPVSLADLELLKKTVNFTDEDEKYLQIAGEVLANQTEEVVKKWRGVIAANPHLAQYSLGPEGKPDAHYSADSGLRFRQWILDTCFRRYDQDWLNYQQEIALRHTSVKKNQTDHVKSAAHIPLRYVIAFTAVINDEIKPFLGAKGHSQKEVERMHRAWCKSVQLQIALWSEPYADSKFAPDEW
jgi:protoglobin